MRVITDNTQPTNEQVKNLTPGYIETLPVIPKSSLNIVDSEPISRVRALPFPNDIEFKSVSNLYRDILQMIRYVGASQQADAIEQLRQMIETINDTAALRLLPVDDIPDKGATTIKDWVKFLKGQHPRIDVYLQNQKQIRLFYFKNISEYVGSIMVLHSADSSTIDPSAWGNQTSLTTNEIERDTAPWYAASFIREDVRQKLQPDVVNFIQSANSRLLANMQRNLPTETWKTTAPVVGSEVWQQRPGLPALTQGIHLNADSAHWTYRVSPPGIGIKEKGLMDSMDYLNHYYDRGDYTVHILVNHLYPLRPFAEAEGHGISMNRPLGVEETFPTKDSNIASVTDMKGQPLFNTFEQIDNSVLVPRTGEES